MKAEDKVGKAAWKRSVTMDQATRLLSSQFFCHMRALPGSSSLRRLDEDKLLE